ncbi:outer membrane protein [Solimonas aquatica]|uniref:Outer membrane protein n=2 Tax=Solimonas aquatica TaxID=489703 RepID=A0A1H9CX77_9GAMM|nr:outer membrane protein [Solimonas aquatica]
MLALVASSAAAANDLLRTYDAALRNDTTLRAAHEAREAALQNEPKARAQLLPQAAASYSYTRNKADATVVVDTAGTATPIGRKIDGTDKLLAVTLTQPVFDLEAWYRLKQADEQTVLADLNYRSAEQNLLLRVAEAYFGMLRAEDLLRSAQAEKTALAKQLDLANQHLQVGISSLIDVQEVQARYDLSVVSELEAQQSRSDAQANLDKLTRDTPAAKQEARVRVVPLNEPPAPPAASTLAPLRDEIMLPSPAVGEVAQWIGHARLENPDVVAALLNYRIAARGLDAAQAHRLPTVQAQVQYNDSNTESGSFPYQLRGTSYGLNFKLPLLAGGGINAEVRQNRALRDQRQAEYEGALREAESSIRKAYSALAIGASRMRAYKQALASSSSALDAADTGLSIGTRSALDVLNARQQRYEAERKYEQSRYDYLLAALRLKSAAGALRVDDLARIDGLLEGY